MSDTDNESVHSRSYLIERQAQGSYSPVPITPPLAISPSPKPTFKNYWKGLKKVQKGKATKAPLSVTYRRVAKDLEHIQTNSLKTSFYTR